MHFNWFFSGKANFKVCIEAQKNFGRHFFPCQSLLLSTSVLNDNEFLYMHSDFVFITVATGYA